MSRDQVSRRRRGLSAFGPFIGGVVEIAVFVVVGNGIGFGYAILLALATSVLGLWLMRRAGFRAWRSLRAAAGAGPVEQLRDHVGAANEPSAEAQIADAGVTLLAGTVLVLPGFVTDAMALLLLIPPVRARVGRRLAAAALRNFPSRQPRGRSTRVVEGEVVGHKDIRGPEFLDAEEQDRG